MRRFQKGLRPLSPHGSIRETVIASTKVREAEAHGVQGEERQLCACAHALPVVIVVPAEEEREALELRIAGEVSAHCVWAE